MKKKTFLDILAVGGLALAISCDGGSAATSSGLGANDCQYGTFRPTGLDDCVFPAADVNNQPIGVSDNRCAFGQPAIPPQCVSDGGERPYLSTSSKCATGYRFLPGSCNRNNEPTGVATGMAGTGIAFPVCTGVAGASTGAAGSFMVGLGGSFGTGAGGSDLAGAGGLGGLGGFSGTGGSVSATDAAATDAAVTDASAEARF